LSRKLNHHPWGSNGWRQYLARLPGAVRGGDKPMRFAAAVSCWVSVPIELTEKWTV